ncbi:MAG TPA: penicillin acylase family protein, partial [Steroidobacteraceae bacterium]|nr:penicillin acylase family protein [Steroidobacteraceae bacterium]
MNRALRAGLAAIGFVGAAAALAILAGYLTLRASLPRLDGQLAERGLAAPLTLERDALGVATITAANRADLAFGTGFAHGQDRFFQMDLARRLAAGELSELVGRAALDADMRVRVFRFRSIAQRALAQATPQQRTLLEAYTRGVNAGLASLGTRPWEYWLLRERPAPWAPEDSILVAYAMWWQLQSDDFDRERTRREIEARIGGPVCAGGWKCALEFLYPSRTEWDAPSVADEAALRAENARNEAPPAIPGPDEVDLRGRGAADRDARVGRAEIGAAEPADIGSNGWAVAGRFTGSGAALVASDMHLPLAVPPTWYRVRLRMPGLDLNGLTLPGAPALIAGSNGAVA